MSHMRKNLHYATRCNRPKLSSATLNGSQRLRSSLISLFAYEVDNRGGAGVSDTHRLRLGHGHTLRLRFAEFSIR